MKILLYEASSGFSYYSKMLCNALVNEYPDIEILFMTTPDNHELDDALQRVQILPMLKEFGNQRKNSIGWFVNRIATAIQNVKIRNKYIKQNKIDALWIQFTNAVIDQYFIRQAKRSAHIIYYTVHDVIPPVKSFYWSRKSLGRLYAECNELIVHTKGNKQQLIDQFSIKPEKIHVIHHGTDTRYNKLDQVLCRKQFNINQDKKVILFYGSIRKQKGLDDLIDALKDKNNVQLLVAGAMQNGESFDEYEKLIQKNKIDAKCFIQFIPDEWTDALFQACDFVCLPYKYFYSQSGVFMHAIRNRKPVIVSDVSSFREYLSEYRIGDLCKPEDPEDLGSVIEKMMCTLNENKDTFLSELERAADDNSWEKSAKLHMQLFISQKNCETI